jgi:hypothetical protein
MLENTNATAQLNGRCDFAKIQHALKIESMLLEWTLESLAFESACEMSAPKVAACRDEIRAIHTARAAEGCPFAIAALAMMDA